MSSIFLSTEVLIGIFLDFLLLLSLSYALVRGLGVMKLKQKNLSREEKAEADKKLYLFNTLVRIAFILKVVLLVFFTYTLDELSSIVPGAMCATGVVDSNAYGVFLFVLKFINIIALALWLGISNEKLQKKTLLFIGLYIFMLIEFLLLLTFYTNISMDTFVSCCSVKYVSDVNSIPFNFSKETLIGVFFTLYALIILSVFIKSRSFLLLSASLFIYTAYYVLIYYFGTYIYEDSTHKCPFCMLKQEYNFIGYFIYSSLLVFIYYILVYIMHGYEKYTRRRIIILLTIFVLMISINFILDEVFFV